MRTGEVLYQEEKVYDLTTGKPIYAFAIKSPLYDEEGNVILPSYFTKIEGKDKDAEDYINNLLQ